MADSAASSVASKASWCEDKSTMRRSEWTREAEKEKTGSRPSKPSASDRHVREFAKRIKVIYEDEGRDYGSDTTDTETLIDRFRIATGLREKRVAEVFRNIRRSRNVELCFLVDATGSMQPHIDGVRRSINEIVQKLTDTAPHVSFAVRNGSPQVQDLKIAFVAYRDHCDHEKQFEILKFTKSTTDFQNFCAKIVASGGGDGPEDVFGGLDNALNLDWSDNAGTKVIFHICDAPCHGKEFHSGLGDDYPRGDPKGRTHTALFAKIRSKCIQYHFGKINSYTDIMVRKFAEAYGDAIVDFNVKDVEKIRESVITAVSVSVSSSIATSKASGGISRELKTYTFDKGEPDWDRCPTKKGHFMSYEFPDAIKDIEDDVPMERRQRKSAEVKIASKPFSKGAERVAFYGLDVSSFYKGKGGTGKADPGKVEHKNEGIVLKEYLHKGKGMNSIKRYELSNQMQTIAAFLAQKFVEDVKNKMGVTKTIKFVKIRTISMTTDSGDRFMSCERRFAKDSKFVRFTNNTDYNILEEKAAALGVSRDFLQLVMAFSHWTYKASNRFLMVVDLEGIVTRIGSGEEAVLLTDPAIHSKDITRYGPMNHGKRGMEGFFGNHICNQYCIGLGIKDFKPSVDD